MYDELVKRLRDAAKMSEALAVLLTNSKGNATAKLYKEAADAIEELSKERKTGEWCADYDGYSDGEPVYDMWWCSACGEYFDEWDDRPTWKYCPNCGTKMSGGDEDEEPPKEGE